MRNLFYYSSVILAICIGLTHELSGKRPLQKKLCAILTQNTTDNVVFSPFSLNTALSLLYHGSEGQVALDLKRLLRLGKPKQVALAYESLFGNLKYLRKVKLDVATKLFVSKDIKLLDDFKTLATKQYNAEEENVDFIDVENAAATMNDWVSKQTKDKIKSTIKPNSIEPLSSMILLNVIDFNGNWSHPFRNLHEDETQQFYVSEESHVKCELMTVVDYMGYAENKELDAKVVALSYKTNKFSLILVLPNKRMGYVDVQRKLAETDASVSDRLTIKRGRVTLPKFQVESQIDFKEPLSKAGLEIIFSNQSEFSHITKNPVQLSQFKQSLFFKVDVGGTQSTAVVDDEKEYSALSATAFNMKPSLPPYTPPIEFEFVADHPFLFFLEYSDYDTYTMFQGRVSTV